MTPAPISRRRLGRTSAAGAVALAAAGCAGRGGPAGRDAGGSAPAAQGRLSFRPSRPTRRAAGRRGEFTVPAGPGPRARVLVPSGDGPMRLVVLLHGANGAPEQTTGLLRPYAEDHRLLVVAPKSLDRTWDVIAGGFGPDVRAVDALLGLLSDRYPVAGRTIAGFSDGASYALTLGLANGDVFDSVIAFSPGFEASRTRNGRPRFFFSHGVDDDVLPIDRCSRPLVADLEADGYDVTFEEFDGGHQVPQTIREQALAWLQDG